MNNDIWNFLHGTGAGCASIVAWEALHAACTGTVLLLVYSGVTVVIIGVVKYHRRALNARVIVIHKGKPRGHK